jgi:hypothetical protein
MGNRNRKQVHAYNPDEIERYDCLHCHISVH